MDTLRTARREAAKLSAEFRRRHGVSVMTAMADPARWHAELKAFLEATREMETAVRARAEAKEAARVARWRAERARRKALRDRLGPAGWAAYADRR